MIDGGFGKYYIECDLCGNDEDGFDDFHEAVEFKKDKSNGWRSIKIDDEWYDICPECKIKDLKNMIKKRIKSE